MAEVLAFREIAHDDIDELAALVADAFVGHCAFASNSASVNSVTLPWPV